MPLNYSEDGKILKWIKKNRQATLMQPRLLGAKYSPFLNKCEGCGFKLNNMPVCIIKDDKEHKQIKYLCSKCRSMNERFIIFYIILKL